MNVSTLLCIMLIRVDTKMASSFSYLNIPYSNLLSSQLKSSCKVYLRIGLFDSIYAFQCTLNVLLEPIEPFNIVQCTFICANCSIGEYRSDFSPLCWHNMPTYYALNYAGIFDGGLMISPFLNIFIVNMFTWCLWLIIITFYKQGIITMWYLFSISVFVYWLLIW